MNSGLYPRIVASTWIIYKTDSKCTEEEKRSLVANSFKTCSGYFLLFKSLIWIPDFAQSMGRVQDYTYEPSATKKGGELWTSQGFSYIRNSSKDGVIYLKCRTRKCKGNAKYIQEGDQFYISKPHICHFNV